MLKSFLIFIISLFLISCTTNKIINKTVDRTENIKVFGNVRTKNVSYIFYKDFSKESILLKTLSDRFLGLSYRVVAIPLSKIDDYNKYYKKDDNNILFSLGESLYYLGEILKSNYNSLIIDTPSKFGDTPKALNPNKTLIILDPKTIKYGYKIMNDKNYKIDLRYDKYAWLLNSDNSIKEILEFHDKVSKIPFNQERDLISLNNNESDKVLLLFSKNRSFLKECDLKCKIDKGYVIKSVYKPINKNYYISDIYIKRSLIIKKIFNLIKNEEYLDSYLLLLENKNIINFENFKKIFDFIKEPLYNLEPEIEKFNATNRVR